jgi:hypothetical protein
MVEVFKTNVRQTREAKKLIEKINGHFPDLKTNFDLTDCDKILRIEGNDIPPHRIIELLNADNYQCTVLE